MAKLSANDYRLFVDNGSGTFNQIAGQISHNVERGEESTPTSDKSSTLATTMRVMKNLVINSEYKPDLPDTTGHTRLETLYASGAATAFQIRKSPFAVGDIVLHVTSYRVTSMPGTSQFNDVHGTSLVLNASPGATIVVDALA